MSAFLSIRGLRHSYDGRQVLDVGELDLFEGEILAVIGPNGSGKSTLLRVINLLEKPVSGELIFWNGARLSRLSRRERRELAREIAMIFQEPLLFKRSVRANVAYGLNLRRLPREEKEKRIREILERLDLTGLADREATTLSGGEAQKATLGRAMVLRPRLLLLDEPLASLDMPTRKMLLRDISRLVREMGVTAVFVTHDHHEVLEIADRLAVLIGGRLLQVGEPGRVFSRPASDVVAEFLGAENLLEGKVAVLVDGSPVALTMPRLFYETVQTPEDYYSRPYNSSLIRLLRLSFLAVSVLLPAFYVAAVNFDPEMIPFKLIVTIASAREGVPFPLVLEVVFFGLLFEGLREAGVRLPRPVGQAVTIVGALIIGTAAVDAGLVSSVTVIVTALVGIAGFITPGFTDVYIFSRIVLVLLSGLLGFFGLVLGLMFFYTHLCSLRSFGVPYMTPIAPAEYRGWKDVFVRAPLWLLSTRPPFLAKGNVRRMGPGAKPRPPRDGDREEGTF